MSTLNEGLYRELSTLGYSKDEMLYGTFAAEFKECLRLDKILPAHTVKRLLAGSFAKLLAVIAEEKGIVPERICEVSDLVINRCIENARRKTSTPTEGAAPTDEGKTP